MVGSAHVQGNALLFSLKQFFKQSLLFLWELSEIAIIALVSVFVIRSFIVQPFLVKGASMEPNFSNGDYLLVDEISLHFRDPERGEVVVFRFPRDPSTFYIKRIIGLPGETVKIRDNMVYLVRGGGELEVELGEEYLRTQGVTGEEELVFHLDANEYLVMGDNRSYSFDSRAWGPVPRDKIVGLARVRLWPLNEITLVEAPIY